MGTEKFDVVEWILYILFAIFAILFIIQITLKIIGGSPNEIQLLISGVVGIIMYLFSMSYKMGRLDETLRGIKRRLSKMEDHLTRIEAKI